MTTLTQCFVSKKSIVTDSLHIHIKSNPCLVFHWILWASSPLEVIEDTIRPDSGALRSDSLQSSEASCGEWNLLNLK